MSIKFQDSYGRQFSIERTLHEKKGFLGRVKVDSRIRLTIGDKWAEFEEAELTEGFFEAKNIAESICSTSGPVFIANVDWAPESSLFQKQVAEIPVNWWVFCFMNFDFDCVQLAFAPEDFKYFLNQIPV